MSPELIGAIVTSLLSSGINIKVTIDLLKKITRLETKMEFLEKYLIKTGETD